MEDDRGFYGVFLEKDSGSQEGVAFGFCKPGAEAVLFLDEALLLFPSASGQLLPALGPQQALHLPTATPRTATGVRKHPS